MALKIVRNDITKMEVDAIVNTANAKVFVGNGCDRAIYEAAGYETLLSYRKENIGEVKEGEVFLTPGFSLGAKNIIHAVSPQFIDGSHKEDEKLRKVYKKALQLAEKNSFKSVAFPLISTGSFGYPKEEGLRIAIDGINEFLKEKDLLVYLTVFDEESLKLGQKVTPELEEYINSNYVEKAIKDEYMAGAASCAASQAISPRVSDDLYINRASARLLAENYLSGEEKEKKKRRPMSFLANILPSEKSAKGSEERSLAFEEKTIELETVEKSDEEYDEMQSVISDGLKERMKHLTDTFSEYLLYLIESKGMNNASVYKNAVVDKKTFSKIKNNPDAHPQKITALCLCVGARLNLDETKDLLSRAGYALSPCDKTDVIFSYFIENGIYDMVEIDIQLENHGLECVIK